MTSLSGVYINALQENSSSGIRCGDAWGGVRNALCRNGFTDGAFVHLYTHQCGGFAIVGTNAHLHD